MTRTEKYIAIIDGQKMEFDTYEAAAEATDQSHVSDWSIIRPDGTTVTPADVRQD